MPIGIFLYKHASRRSRIDVPSHVASNTVNSTIEYADRRHSTWRRQRRHRAERKRISMNEFAFDCKLRRKSAGYALLLRQNRQERAFRSLLKIFTSILISIFPILIFPSCVRAADEFARVRCGRDIPRALSGRPESGNRVAITEAKYRGLGLRHLGASIIDDQTNTIHWFICGREYVLLDRRNVIADVILFPPHSRTSPAFEGLCKMNGRETSDSIVAVLDGKFESGKLLPARQAWRIDNKKAKFIKIDASRLLCPSEGIFTADGGM